MDFPSLDQEFSPYEAVERLISLIDSRLFFLIFPFLFCPIFVYFWFLSSCFFSSFFHRFFFGLFLCYIYQLCNLCLSLSRLNISLSSLIELLISKLLVPSYVFFLESLGEYVPFRLKTADLLFLGTDDVTKRSVISDLLHKDARIRMLELSLLRSTLRNFLHRRRALELETPYSRASVIGGIKFNLSNFGELQTPRRLWRDYSARRGAVVYVVNVDTVFTTISEWDWEARAYLGNVWRDLNHLLNREDFEMVPFLILCTTAAAALEEEFRALLEEQLCTSLGLTNMRTGRGRVDLAGRNVRPLEVFVVEKSNRRHLDAIMWLSQYFE